MKILLQLTFFSILLISCRQDIIEPDNPAGNINEPQLTRTNFSYSFTINADKITRTVVDNTNLNTVKSWIYAIVTDHSSGSVEVVIKSRERNILYSVILSNNSNGTFKELEGHQPSSITINFINFSGKFRVTVTDRE